MPSKERKKAPSYHEIIVCMLDSDDGIASIKALGFPASKHTLLRAVLHLRGKKKLAETERLMAYIQKLYPKKSQARKPVAGMERDYNVWEQDGTLQIRIPVGVLPVTKRSKVKVLFNTDVIEIRPKK